MCWKDAKTASGLLSVEILQIVEEKLKLFRINK